LLALIWPSRLPSGREDGPTWEERGQEAAVAFSDYGLCGEDSVLSRSKAGIFSGSKIPGPITPDSLIFTVAKKAPYVGRQ
jgi:hypothetical protein